MKKRTLTRLTAFLMAIMLLLCACSATNGSSVTTTDDPKQPNPNCTHRDANDDGTCDACGENVLVDLDFYAVNDLHGVFCDTGNNPGVDEMTTFFKNAVADDSAYEIILSSGDMWQGSVESSSNKGQLMTQWMNEVGFVSMTLGNHEYDWGSSWIAENAALAKFPFLGINVIDHNTDTPYCQASTVVERGGVKIGIIGAIGNCLSSISGEFTDGLEFVTGKALTELVKAEATRLRADGCDFIVYSIHEGSDNTATGVQDAARLEYYDMELSNGYVDLVFEAHSHQDYILRDLHGVYHIQAGGYNSAMSYVSVSYNTVTDHYSVQTVDTLDKTIYADASLEDDAIVEELFEKYFSEEDPYRDVIGYNSKKRSSNEIAQIIAQLYLEKGRACWGDEYDIVLGGGFIKCRTPYNLAAGNVTYSQLFSLLPFDNALVLCQVTGRQLKQIFVNSNNRNYHCAYDENLQIDENKTYYVVTDTYTSFYKYNQLTEVARLENYYARDLLKDFIAAANWGSTPKMENLR